MRIKSAFFVILALMLSISLFGCHKKSEQQQTIAEFPDNTLEQVIDKQSVTIDRSQTDDGSNVLRIDAQSPTVVHLFALPDPDIENATLVYQAKLHSENLEGRAYLEMWCSFPKLGRYFSRGMQSPVSGNTAWTTVSTPFFLKEGQNPDNVELNLVIEGKGTVWIDDIRLLQKPLP